MKQLTSPPRPVGLAVLTMAAGLLLAGCSGGDPAPVTPPGPGAPPAAATVIPTAWIDAAAQAWPDSDGRKAGAMVVSAGAARQCVLGDEPVRVLGTEFTWDSSGYGPLDPTTDTADSFVHRCTLSDAHHLPGDFTPARAAGEVVLTRYTDAARLQKDVARFRSQTNTPVQNNEVTHLTSGRYAVEALRRWYPTNPQGLYDAMVVDEQQRATFLLEVNSLSREDFEAASAQKVADALTDFLDRSHSAPAAAPAATPEWADSLWQDAGNRFQIPIAKGWQHRAADGSMEDPTTLASFYNNDGAASMAVIPTPLRNPLPLSTAVEKVRAGYRARPGASLVSEQPMTLDDATPAHRMDFTLSGGQHLMSVLVVTDHYLFQIIGKAPTDRWETTQADMTRMTSSLTTH
jgi:hypothetical protein